MGEKKRPGRFTIQFNVCDPQQKMAADLLNQQGRSKARFLTSAVLHYINCPERPEFRAAPPLDTEALEKLVLDILTRNRSSSAPKPEADETISPADESQASPNPDTDAERWFGGKEGVASILSSLELFRNM